MPATPLSLDRARHLDVPDGRIAYYETGATDPAAPVIVWVHGLPLDSRSWAPPSINCPWSGSTWRRTPLPSPPPSTAT